MNEIQLLRICLLVAVLGIIGLFFLSKTITAENITIDSLTQESNGKTVQITGTASAVRISKDITFITLEQPESSNTLPVVFFQKLSLDEGAFVQIFGTVKEYKGSLEVVGERIEILERGE